MKVIIYLLLGIAICRLFKINGLIEILIWPVTLAVVLADKILEWLERKSPGR